MKEIYEEIDRVGLVCDDDVGYHPKEHAFTLDEFRAFTDAIWKNAGGWDASDHYLMEDAYFETYAVPFKHEDKKYVLTIMNGQGTAITVMTEKEYDNYQNRLTVLNQQKYLKEEDSEEV